MATTKAKKPAPRRVRAQEVAGLRALERKHSYDELIEGLRQRVAADRRVLTNTWVKGWCGRRWRDLFLTEAAADEQAVRAASRRLAIPGRDRRSPRQRIAERFLARDQEDWRLDLPPAARPRTTEVALVFCPGLVSTLVPALAFGESFPRIEKELGLRVVRAGAHPVRSCEANVTDLVEAIEHGRGSDAAGRPVDHPRAPGDVVLLGYSKGTPDALTLLVRRPDLAPRVRALVAWAGAAGGSYAADGIYGGIKDLRIDLGPRNETVKNLVKALLPVARLDGMIHRPDEWDLKAAVRDLTTTERARFLRRHAREIDALDVPIFCLVAIAGTLEVPYFQLQGSIEIGRREGDNDMQLSVAQSCMKTPMATTLAHLHGHHWDVALEPFPTRFRMGSPNLDHRFPRHAAATATFLLLAELGLLD